MYLCIYACTYLCISLNIYMAPCGNLLHTTCSPRGCTGRGVPGPKMQPMTVYREGVPGLTQVTVYWEGVLEHRLARLRSLRHHKGRWVYRGCTGILNFSGSDLAKYPAVGRFKELKKNRLSMEAQKSVLIISWGVFRGCTGVYIYTIWRTVFRGCTGVYIYIRKKCFLTTSSVTSNIF